jgi:hypothetical protein
MMKMMGRASLPAEVRRVGRKQKEIAEKRQSEGEMKRDKDGENRKILFQCLENRLEKGNVDDSYDGGDVIVL